MRQSRTKAEHKSEPNHTALHPHERDNKEISELFDEAADLLSLHNENPFRIRAYRNAARSLRDLDQPLKSLAADPTYKLTDIPGIGKDLAAKIKEILSTGEFKLLSQLRQQIPTGTRDLLQVPGIGPKKARQLERELGIHSLEELRAATEAHQLANVKGFGTKTEANILTSLTQTEAASGRMLLDEASDLATRLTSYLAITKGKSKLEVAGSYRRSRETVGDLDLVAYCDDATELMDRLQNFDDQATVLGRGATKMSVRLASGRQVDLRVVPRESFGAALLYFTGSKSHNIELRKRAQNLGLKLNEYGLFDGAFARAGSTEEEVYATLGLAWIPPELREGDSEIELAANGRLPQLVEIHDIRGDLHVHTNATDGRHSLLEMITGAQRLHYQYVAITDHSQRVTVAKGLDEFQLQEQWSNINNLRDQFPDIQILRGVELDILEDGALDLPKETLKEADWVIAAIHYGLKQSPKVITKRLTRAIQSGLVHAIAHPTGRLIGKRSAYDFDWTEVCKAAADYACALEINGQPLRLDLNEQALSRAMSYPVNFVVNSDAHSMNELNFMKFAVSQARRGGLAAPNILNSRDVSLLTAKIATK